MFFLGVLGEVDLVGPAAGDGDGPLCEGEEPLFHGGVIATGSGAEVPGGGFLGELGADGGTLDETADVEEVLVFLDGEALVAALVDRAHAGGAVEGVEALGVGDGDEAEEVGEFAVLGGGEDHLPLIGEEAVGEELGAEAELDVAHDIKEVLEIGGLFEEFGFSGSTVHDVVDHAAGCVSQSSWHGGEITRTGGDRQEFTPDPYRGLRIGDWEWG